MHTHSNKKTKKTLTDYTPTKTDRHTNIALRQAHTKVHKGNLLPDTHISTQPTSHTYQNTHTHAANLTDSSAALIADLNRPGDLSLSLTHTQHTSFFHLFPPLSLLPSLSSFFLAQISPAFSQCHFTLAYSCPSPLPYYLYQKCLGPICTP